MRSRLAYSVATIACASSLAACGSNAPPDLAQLESSQQPYFYVGESFDGLDLEDVLPYDAAGVASLFYGSCQPASYDAGCAPPLELQHRLCGGRLTIVVFVGTDPKPGRAARAARALRPLSRGAVRVKPRLAFDSSPPC